MKLLRILTVLILLSAAFLTCSSNKTTRVTIYFGENGQAALEQEKIPLIERFLRLFGSEAYAATYQTSDTDHYLFYVDTKDDTLTSMTIPGTQNSISIEVSSGKDRVFTLISYSTEGYANYLGRERVDLTGGDKSISIDMYPCVSDSNFTYSNSILTLSWTMDSTISEFTAINIYKACEGNSDDSACDGSFILLTTLADSATTYTDDSSFVSGEVAYYIFQIDPSVSGSDFTDDGIAIPADIDELNDYYFWINWILAEGISFT